MGILTACLFVRYICAWCCGGQKMVPALLGLELHTAVSYQVRAENWTWVHWRNSLCFGPQEQLLESPVVYGCSNVIGLTKCITYAFLLHQIWRLSCDSFAHGQSTKSPIFFSYLHSFPFTIKTFIHAQLILLQMMIPILTLRQYGYANHNLRCYNF